MVPRQAERNWSSDHPKTGYGTGQRRAARPSRSAFGQVAQVVQVHVPGPRGTRGLPDRAGRADFRTARDARTTGPRGTRGLPDRAGRADYRTEERRKITFDARS
jgi:hypothetical protein